MQHSKILILDFGSQVTQLIARRVRESGVYSEIRPFNIPESEIRAFAQKFQPVLLMAASYFTGYHDAGITQHVVNAFLEKLWGARDSTTLEQAQEEFDKSVYLVLVDRLVVPHFYTGSGNAKNLTKLYDNLLAKNKTFQQRYETLEALWATP